MFDISGYTEAGTVAEAIRIASADDNAIFMAGGTDILVKCRARSHGYVDREIVGISQIPELQGIRTEENGSIFIGAAVTFTQLESDPVIIRHLSSLAAAAASVGGPQIRNMGTIGGNICNGVTSADTAPSLLTLNAMLIIEGKTGRREARIADFYTGPGSVKLDHGELLIGIRIVKEDYEGYTGHYMKFAQRKAMDISTLGCAVWVKMDLNTIEDLRIAFGVAGPVPLRAVEAEKFAVGKEPAPDILREIGVKCLESSRARNSWRASKEFREHLVKELPVRALRVALGI